MDKNEVIKILLNEQTCVKTADICDRDCAKCSLVMDSEKIIEAYNLAIKLLSEQRWIPCSERLPEHPENDDYYLVTIQCEHYDGWDDYVTGFAEWTKHGWDELSCYIGQIKVVAWMPLPEPWGGEQG